MKNINISNQNDYLEILKSINYRNILKHPNILIAANFWEQDRYFAAKICYSFMRAVDDMIDNYKAENTIIEDCKKVELLNNVNTWISQIKGQNEGKLIYGELQNVVRDFKIPLWPFEKFSQSMIYDIYHDGFPTFDDFVEYSNGASVSPAAVFVHLCGITHESNEYAEPVFDVMKAATPCAMFSYIVHIIRDFQKDQMDHLNYFAGDIMEKYGVTRKELYDIANESMKISPGFRMMMGEYYTIADRYRLETYKIIDRIKPFLEPRYQLSLEIIFNLYLMVFERIDIDRGQFTAEELNPGLNDILIKVNRVIENFKAYEPGSNSSDL